MTTYLVSVSLTLPVKKYRGFFVLMDRMGAAEVLPGIFALRSDHDIDQMRVALLPYLEKADRVLIAAVSGEVAIRNALCDNGALQHLFANE
jgi:hypothetical protein